jgi:antitoxin component of MazEF toxin-antitoxin module
METTTKTEELIAKLRATTAIARLGDSDALMLPERIRQAAGLVDGDTVYIEAIDNGDGEFRVRLRKIDPDQSWFWTPEWQAGEMEADAAKAEGRSTVYYSADEFIDSLK